METIYCCYLRSVQGGFYFALAPSLNPLKEITHFCHCLKIAWSGAGLIYSALHISCSFFLLCVFLKALNQSKSINQYVNCLKRPNEQTLPFVEEMSHSSQRPDKNTLTVFAELLVLSFTVRFVCTFCQIIIQQLCPVHVMF